MAFAAAVEVEPSGVVISVLSFFHGGLEQSIKAGLQGFWGLISKCG
jgi:hypothetical protein